MIVASAAAGAQGIAERDATGGYPGSPGVARCDRGVTASLEPLLSGLPVASADGLSDEAVEAVIAAGWAVVALTARCLQEVAGDVSVPQYHMLLALAGRRSRRVADLAAVLGVHPSSASRMIDSSTKVWCADAPATAIAGSWRRPFLDRAGSSSTRSAKHSAKRSDGCSTPVRAARPR